LNSMRSQAVLYTGTGTAFATTACATTAGRLFETANNGLGTLLTGLTLASTRCGSAVGLPSNGTTWAVAALTSTGAWCVDSTGASRDKTATGITYTDLASTNPGSAMGTAVNATSCR